MLHRDLMLQIEELRQGGRFAEATRLCRRAAGEEPNEALWRVELAHCHLDVQEFDAAADQARQAIALQPNAAAAYFCLGLASHITGANDAALAAYTMALQLDPNLSDARIKLGKLLLSIGRSGEAVQLGGGAVDADPSDSEAHLLLAEALAEQGLNDEAELQYQCAGEGDSGALTAQANRLQVMGRFERAAELFRKAIDAEPSSAAAYYGLVRGGRQTTEDQPLIEEMRARAAMPALPMSDRIFFHYALGKSLEDLGEYGDAMRHFDEGNGLVAMSRNLGFSLENVVNLNNWRMRYFAKAHLERIAAGNPSRKPLFVVGMIRSGTTLLEQILSCHPQIGTAGEQLFWTKMQPEYNRLIAERKIGREFIKATASSYLELVEAAAPGKERVIDKMPLNLFSLGQIHVTFPNAVILHCRRHPVDTCLSIYTTYFEISPQFAHVRANIVAYYREYLRLMAHWRESLPDDRFVEVDYEELVANREAVLRRLLPLLGLHWDDSCLRHESNARSIRTPSLWQVRQPIYRSSIDRWKSYQPWLGEFTELL